MNATHIEADHIRYEGDHLSLDGHVMIHHPMALLKARHALLETKSEQLLKAEVQEEVNFKFSSERTLECDEATVDFISYMGSMIGKEVSFKDPTQTYQNHPLFIRGPQIDFTFAPSSLGGYDLTSLCLSKGILLHYCDDYYMKGDRGEYRIGKTAHEEIEMSSNDPYGCQIVHEKNQLFCDSLLVDVKKTLLYMHHVKGRFFHSKISESLYFETDELSYDDLHHQCLFTKGAYLLDGGIGTIKSMGIVELKKSPFQTTFSFDQMNTKGKVVFDFMNESEPSHLECYGISHLDKRLGLFTADKPSFALPFFAGFRQNVYERGALRVTCDHITMEYSEKKGNLLPTLLHFSGNVVMRTRDSYPFDHVLCDDLTYDLGNDMMTLLAKEGNAISFHKTNQEMTLYAEKIEISHKKTIQAFGRTEFIFPTQEKNFFQQKIKSPPR